MKFQTSIRFAALLLCCLSLAMDKPPATTTTKVAKPTIVTSAEWGSKPLPIPDSSKHTPKRITIHHSGTEWKVGQDPAKFVKALQEYGQREKNWPDLPYHFMIAPDGQIFECRPMNYKPQSNTKYDLDGHIGVELMGNFETQRPSLAQLQSTVALIAWICQEKNIAASQIAGHKDHAEKQTVCPGKDLYRYLEGGQIIKWVKQTLAGEKPEIQMGKPLSNGPKVIVGTPSEN